jgi:transposase
MPIWGPDCSPFDTAHVNRIKGLLFGQGIRGINVKSKYKTLQIDKLVTGDGCPLPPRLTSEITREIARLALIQEQIATLECERDQAPTPCKATEKKRVQLMCLTHNSHSRLSLLP